MQKLCTAQASGDLSFLGNSVATSHMAQYEVEEPSLTQCIGWQRLCQGLAWRVAQLGAPYAKNGRFWKMFPHSGKPLLCHSQPSAFPGSARKCKTVSQNRVHRHEITSRGWKQRVRGQFLLSKSRGNTGALISQQFAFSIKGNSLRNHIFPVQEGIVKSHQFEIKSPGKSELGDTQRHHFRDPVLFSKFFLQNLSRAALQKLTFHLPLRKTYQFSRKPETVWDISRHSQHARTMKAHPQKYFQIFLNFSSERNS